MASGRLHVPLSRPEDVIPHLGAAHHWKEGRSAKSLVDQWWAARGLPQSVSNLLDQSGIWRRAGLIDAFVERRTDLEDGRATASQTDLLAIVAIESGLGVIGIEAKVDEGFDKTVDEWLADASPGKTARLAKLCALFDLSPNSVGELRYQLFHRTAAAIIEARRYRAGHAAMVVQSWSSKLDGFEDYSRFFHALGIDGLESGRLSAPLIIGGTVFCTGWLVEEVPPSTIAGPRPAA